MEENKRYKVYNTIMIIAISAFITFFITSIWMYNYFKNEKESNKDISSTLDYYHSVLDEYYLGEINDEDLKNGAIKGYIEGLGDPYTEYISKEDLKDYMEDTMGNYTGIGVYIVKNTSANKIQILAPIKNSPAEKAGLLPGDLIVSVDGVSYVADDMMVASNNIKGEEGTTVELEILRNNETKKFEIKRENIKINPIDAKMLENQIGYITFSSFDTGTAKDFKLKFDELKSQGMKSLIIDLRNNGGGIVNEALDIADYFIDKDQILLYEVDKNGNEETKISKEDPTIDIPTVILVNENTASSSEILTAIMQDFGKAKAVGTKTFGKGIIQTVLFLQDGSGLKVTSEKYLTPKKREINKVGIEPDEKVELPESVENILSVKEEEDTQLKKAIEMLK